MNELRTVMTNDGAISYTLVRKKMKRLTIHVDHMGNVIVSVPLRCAVDRVDNFVIRECEWIRTRQKAQREKKRPELLPELNDRECYELLLQAVRDVYPLVQDKGVQFPVVKVRRMRSMWGNCHWAQGYITMNHGLHRCPEHLRRYVALHELVHFLHRGHGKGFYGAMDELMPSWREWRKELEEYGFVID